MTKPTMIDARIDWIELAAKKGLPSPSRDELAAFADGYAAANHVTPPDVRTFLEAVSAMGFPKDYQYVAEEAARVLELWTTFTHPEAALADAQAAIRWLVEEDWPEDYDAWPKDHLPAIKAAFDSTTPSGRINHD